MYINPIIELSMILEQEQFQEVLEESYSGSDDISVDNERYIDESLGEKGILILYRNSQYKKNVKLIVNPMILMNDEEYNADKLILKLDKYISRYFREYCLEDFYVTGTTFISNITAENKEILRAYKKIFHRIGKVKKFTPVECEELDDAFRWRGNSNGQEFLVYNPDKAIKNREKNSLRLEVRLTKQKAIRSCTGEETPLEQIRILLEKKQDIFMSVVVRIIPYGDCYKKEEAVNIICREVKNLPLRRRMISLVTLVPSKKSLLLAQQALNCRKMDEVMDELARINLSPITISKRQDVKYLDNFYSYILK